MMIDKTNIRKLIEQYELTIDWLADNPSAPIPEFDRVANKMAVLSVRINIYYKKNKI